MVDGELHFMLHDYCAMMEPEEEEFCFCDGEGSGSTCLEHECLDMHT